MGADDRSNTIDNSLSLKLAALGFALAVAACQGGVSETAPQAQMPAQLPPQPTPRPTPQPTPQPTPPPSPQPPTQLFDLSNFKLTLPVDSSGGAKGPAATISTKDLVAGYASEYFQAGPSGTLDFFAPTNGATTTPGSGSDHTRSELRELYTPTETEWTNRIGGTLSATCHVLQAPRDSSHSVTIGQIHSLSGILLILGYSERRQEVEARVYSSPKSSNATAYVMRTKVKIGDRIAYSIQWIGSTLSVTVNGTTKNWDTASSWNNEPVYFKLGAYSSAPDSGNPPGDATKVSFERFYIQH